jgi:hypothetical protein
MNPSVSTTVAGDLGTKWRRFTAVTIVQPVEVANHLLELTDPRLLPTRCRLFHPGHVLVARDHVEVRPPDKYLECLSSNLLNHLNHIRFKIGGLIHLIATVSISYILHSDISFLITSIDKEEGGINIPKRNVL